MTRSHDPGSTPAPGPSAADQLETLYRELIEGQAAVTWVTTDDPETTTYMSPQVEAFLGYPVERWLEPGFWRRTLHPEDAERVVANAYRDDDPEDFEHRAVAADGRVHWVLERVRSVRDADGRRIRRIGVTFDITERREREAALQDAEARYRRLLELERDTARALAEGSARLAGAFDAIADPILILSAIRDADGEVVDTRVDHANPAWRRLVREADAGLDPTGRPFAATFPELAERLANHRRVIETGEPFRAVLLAPHAGRLMDIQYVKYGDGVIAVSRDVTDERRATAESARAEERFELAATVASIGIYELDHRTGWAWWSPVLREIHGIGPEVEASTEGLVAFIHPGDRDRVVEQAARALGPGGSGRHATTYRAIRPDGSIRWISVQARTFMGTDGRPERSLGVHHDVTERESAIARLRLSEERYRVLVTELDAIVSEHDELLGRSFFSEQARDVLGYEPARLAEPGFWRTLVIPEDRARVTASWDRMVRTAESPMPDFDLEYRVHHADGRVLWLAERYHAVRDDDGLPLRWYGVVFDVTESRRLADAMARTSRLEAISRLATVTAHDFGNVLLGISMFRSMLAESLPPDDPAQRYVRQIEAAVERGGRMSSQLMAFGRDRAASSGPVDVDAVLGDLGPMLERVGGARAVVTIDPSGCRVLMDRTSLEQAILNLVINATDAMPDGGTIRINCAPVELAHDTGLGIWPGRYVRLTVADTGRGMTPDVLERALEPFFTTKPHGTGIGLSSVYGAVREAGGAIQLLSERGQGTTAHLFLPVAPAPPVRRRREPRGA